MRRIAFLFNHDQLHQVAHSLPIALALIERGDAEISLIVTNSTMKRAVTDMAGDALNKAKLIELAPQSPFSRAATLMLDRFLPAAKLAVYRDHLELFATFDALVVSEKSSLLLKTHYGLNGLKFVHTRHGAGDRAIGFNAESALFDLILVSGTKIRDRLMADAGARAEQIAIVGYCKFDRFAALPVQRLFANDRPTVLYNPHPSPKLSSWYIWGNAILEHFAAQDRFNLIFAPHVMLFERKWTITIDPPAVARVRRPDTRYFQIPHIHVDLGSEASTDMTYTNAADLYLGDVSSQIYEFLVRPRPCLFLNAQQVEWRRDPSYTHWTVGPVLNDIAKLGPALDSALSDFQDYRPTQAALLEETFSVTSTPAANRGAQAIMALWPR